MTRNAKEAHSLARGNYFLACLFLRYQNKQQHNHEYYLVIKKIISHEPVVILTKFCVRPFQCSWTVIFNLNFFSAGANYFVFRSDRNMKASEHRFLSLLYHTGVRDDVGW